MKARRETLWGLLGLSAFLWVGRADAQEGPAIASSAPRPSVMDSVWLSDKRLTTGEGIRTQNWEFHPGFALEGGYDSNFFLRADTPAEPRVSAWTIRAVPSIFFNSRLSGGDGVASNTVQAPGQTSVATPASFQLRGGAAATIAEFFQGSGPKDSVSSNPQVGLMGNLGLAIAPTGRVGGDLHVAVSRSIQPSNFGDTTASFNRTTPSGGAAIEWRPGGGLFTWGLGYDATYTYFEDTQYKYLNNFEHDISTKGQWRFRPRTSVAFDTTVGFVNYVNTTPQPDGSFVRSRIGLNGLLTNFMGFTLMGGWASTFYDAKAGAPKQDFDSFVGQAELRFFLANPPQDPENRPGLYPSTLSFGYQRDFSTSYIGNFYQSDRGYASLGYFLNRRIYATLGAGVARLSYPESFFETGQKRNDPFVNTMVDASAFFEYRFFGTFGVNASVMYTQMLSDELLPNTPLANPANAGDFDNLRWQRIQALLGVRYVM